MPVSSEDESSSDDESQDIPTHKGKRRRVSSSKAKMLQPSRRQPGRVGSAAQKSLKEAESSEGMCFLQNSGHTSGHSLTARHLKIHLPGLQAFTPHIAPSILSHLKYFPFHRHSEGKDN